MGVYAQLLIAMMMVGVAAFFAVRGDIDTIIELSLDKNARRNRKKYDAQKRSRFISWFTFSAYSDVIPLPIFIEYYAEIALSLATLVVLVVMKNRGVAYDSARLFCRIALCVIFAPIIIYYLFFTKRGAGGARFRIPRWEIKRKRR